MLRSGVSKVCCDLGVAKEPTDWKWKIEGRRWKAEAEVEVISRKWKVESRKEVPGSFVPSKLERLRWITTAHAYTLRHTHTHKR